MRRYWAVAGVALLLVAACGDDDDAVETGSTTTETTATTDPTGATTAPAGSELLVLWPADDIEDTPEAAAAGFMDHYFPDTDVSFGEFAAGDGESGEIQVLGGGEGGDADLLRSTLLLRQVGEGWFVIAAVNPNVTITAPEAQAEVPGDEALIVEGVGRGFEATINVAAGVVGGELVGFVLADGGANDPPAPYSAEIDLSEADDIAGETLAIIALGSTGLEGDPGEFSAIPVVVGA